MNFPTLTITFKKPNRATEKQEMIISSLDDCKSLDISDGLFIDILSLNDIINADKINNVYNLFVIKNSNKLIKLREIDNDIGCGILNLSNGQIILLIDSDREISIIEE